MGIAIIVQNVDFSSLGMGKVHPLNSGPIIEIANVIVGTTCTPTTTITGAVWSLDSNEYATIDSSTGVITIGTNAFGNSVIVKATDPSDQNNYLEKEVTLFYNSVDSGTFNEFNIVDMTSNMRNGSDGNTSNAYRIGSTNTLAISGYEYVMFKTTRPNTSGYNYYGSCHINTAAAGTATGNGIANNKNVCEYGYYSNSSYMRMEKIFPLYEDTTFDSYAAGPSAGQTPISYSMSMQEQQDEYYSTIRTLRVTDISGYKVYAVLLK